MQQGAREVHELRVGHLWRRESDETWLFVFGERRLSEWYLHEQRMRRRYEGELQDGSRLPGFPMSATGATAARIRPFSPESRRGRGETHASHRGRVVRIGRAPVVDLLGVARNRRHALRRHGQTRQFLQDNGL